jgi:biopolymer transport protein ExbB/TolQ
MENVSNLLFWISNGLLIPVIVGLLFLFARSIFMFGSFYRDYILRLKSEKNIKPLVDNLDIDNIDELKNKLSDIKNSEFKDSILLLTNADSNRAFINKTISEYEISSDKKLDNPRLLSKFGPILGLMGTLIPMGPALVGLSTGDIGSMAHNMQVAFATTVIGLLIGAVGYLVLQVMRRWFNADIVKLEYISEIINQKKS